MHVLLTPGPLILFILVPASLGFQRVPVAGKSTTISSFQVCRRFFSRTKHLIHYNLIITGSQSCGWCMVDRRRKEEKGMYAPPCSAFCRLIMS